MITAVVILAAISLAIVCVIVGAALWIASAVLDFDRD